jgi:hypothetical protein
MNASSVIPEAYRHWKLVTGALNGRHVPDKILSRLEIYLVGAYPALAQCLVLQKAA